MNSSIILYPIGYRWIFEKCALSMFIINLNRISLQLPYVKRLIDEGVALYAEVFNEKNGGNPFGIV